MVQKPLAEPVLEVAGLKMVENILFRYIHWIIQRYQQLQFFVAHGESPTLRDLCVPLRLCGKYADNRRGAEERRGHAEDFMSGSFGSGRLHCRLTKPVFEVCLAEQRALTRDK